MTTVLGTQYMCDLRAYRRQPGKNTLQRFPEVKKKLPHIRLFSGHIWHDSPWRRFFPNSHWISKLLPPKYFFFCRKQPLYIASIRHPIDRLHSFFRYLQISPNHPDYHESIKKNDFDYFVQRLIQSNHIKSTNSLCAQITYKPNALNLLKKAKQSFDQRYLAIVPYNKTHELANMIAEVFEVPKVENSIINSNELRKKEPINKETYALLEERFSDDIQLYDYICKGYQEKLVHAKNYLLNLLNKC